ncbi:MAG: HEAT repeat domain-containing protein, partial [Gemmatimonadota bacterium]
RRTAGDRRSDARDREDARRGASGGSDRAGPGPGRSSGIASFVGALARAVHAFHTYPADSPARGDVIERVRERMRSCIAGDGALVIDVTNEGLTVGGEPVATDQGPERALALALRRTYVSTLEIRAGAPTSDFRQLCALLAYPDQLLDRVEDLREILTERGVTHVVAHMVSTHRTIEGGTVPSTLLELVERQRAGRGGTHRGELAEGGWIRLDPSVPLDRVTLEELPLLLRDAPSLGMALHRIAGRRDQELSPTQAVVSYYGEITRLYEACDDSVTETLYRRLADVVRRLPDETRMQLVKREVLPDLVDGRRSGTILKHFAEEEVADSLWLLLDLGIGGVEMLTAGLANLDLPGGDLAGVVDRVSRRLGDEEVVDERWREWVKKAEAARPADDGTAEAASPVMERLRVEADTDGDYLALRSFDLSVDPETTAALDDVVERIAATDPTIVTLRACADILRLGADPQVASTVMRKSRGLFFDLESRGDAGTLADWLARYARVARRHDAHDGEIAAIIREMLNQYVTPEFIRRVAARPPDGPGEPPLVTVICELGETGVGALVDSLATESDLAARKRLLSALESRASDLAAALTDYLSHPKWYVVRNVVMLLGHAGPGWEDAVAEGIEHEHPRVIREAFLGLSRIGTPAALEHTERALRHASAAVRKEAGETVFRFDPDLSHPVVQDALHDRELARHHPTLLRRLLTGAERRDLDGLTRAARRLRWHTLAVWNAERRSLGWHALRLSRSTE